MQLLKNILLIFLVFFFIGISYAQAFSFDFGDNDYYPYWGHAYSPWVAQPAYYYPRIYPRIPSYDYTTMVRKRQRLMGTHDETMDQLHELLYGKYGFDRAVAIKLARKIEVASGLALTGNFYPDAVSAFRAPANPDPWGNKQTFKANSQVLQAAARNLAEELEKQPTAEEGAIFLPKRSISFSRDEPETVPVSAGIWEKYNALSSVCIICHSGFRRPDW